MWAFRTISICFNLPRFCCIRCALARNSQVNCLYLQYTSFVSLSLRMISFRSRDLRRIAHRYIYHIDLKNKKNDYYRIIYIIVLQNMHSKPLKPFPCIYRISYCNFHSCPGQTSLRTSAKRLRFGSRLPLVPPPLTQRLLDDLSAPWRQKSPSEKREGLICIICIDMIYTCVCVCVICH